MKLTDLAPLNESLLKRIGSVLKGLTVDLIGLGRYDAEISLEGVPVRNIGGIIDTMNKLVVHLGGKIKNNNIEIEGRSIHFGRIVFKSEYHRDYFLYIMDEGELPFIR